MVAVARDAAVRLYPQNIIRLAASRPDWKLKPRFEPNFESNEKMSQDMESYNKSEILLVTQSNLETAIAPPSNIQSERFEDAVHDKDEQINALHDFKKRTRIAESNPSYEEQKKKLWSRQQY